MRQIQTGVGVVLMVLIGLGLVAPATARSEPYLDLAGEWRFHDSHEGREESVPNFARPGLDDRDWPIVEIGEEGFGRESAAVWFRRSVLVPADWDDRPLALSLATRGQVEVWVDGENAPQIGSSGAVHGAGEHLFAISARASGTNLEIAIRSSVPAVLVRHGVQRVIPDGFFLGPRDVVPVTARAQRSERAQRRALPHFLLAALFLFVGLFHGVLFWRRRNLRAYLWYGVGIAFLGVWEAAGAYDTLTLFPLGFGHRIFIPLARFAIASMVVFTWTLLRPGRRPWLVRLVVALNVLVGLGVATLGFGTIPPLASPFQDLVAFGGLVVGLYVVVVEGWRGHRAARIILMGLLLHVGVTVWGLADQMGLFGGPPSWFFEVGHLATLLAMGVALTDHFARSLEAAEHETGSGDLMPTHCATTASLLAMSTLRSASGTERFMSEVGIRREPGREVLVRGSLVGRYEIRDWLGQGGMGVVYHAYDPHLARDVAIKIVASSPDGKSGARRQSLLHREAVAMARCTHSNIITIFDVGIVGEEVFLAMEYLHGASLRSWQEGTPPPSGPQLLHAYLEAGRGVSAAHRAGIVHGDFKADNVMCTSDGRVVVLDFGIARPTSTDAPAALVDGPSLNGAGTQAFMAPELSAGSESTPASDQYAFAMSLFAALFATTPGAIAADLEGQCAAARAGELACVDCNLITEALIAALSRALETNSELRHSSMDALLDALDGATLARPSARGQRALPRARP